MSTDLNFHRCDRCSRFVFNIPPTATTTLYCRDCSSTSTDTAPSPPPITASTPFDSVQNYDEHVNYLTATSSYQPRPTPTPTSFINSLKNCTLDLRVLKFLNTCSCAICSEDFKLGERVNRLPCRHWFHSTCVRTWLNLKNTCPLCRHEFPTEPDHALLQSPSPTSEDSSQTTVQPRLVIRVRRTGPVIRVRRRHEFPTEPDHVLLQSPSPMSDSSQTTVQPGPVIRVRRTARMRVGARLPSRRLAEDTLNSYPIRS